ncbi:MAG: phosphoribosylformylglycinamidine cyclo-ligase [Candidatus Omnitrophota bacterium]
MTYKKAGVDVDKANKLIRSLKSMNKGLPKHGVIASIGGFSALFSAKFKGMKEPVLASSTDGVGTKLIVAETAGKHDTVGIDLVGMCVNDIIACGARPLFFLDYFATGRLNPVKMLRVVRGILKGCKEAGCSLIGGETAELPGLYKNEEYDMAGFCVGVVDRRNVIDGSKIRVGDVVLGIESSGPHSNGYSLIRKVFSTGDIKGRFKEALLKPTIIYVKPVLALLEKIKINGICHITGGGFYDNISRVLPKGCSVVLNPRSWKAPEIFSVIQERSRLDNRNMFFTFNMGIGLALILKREYAYKAQKIIKRFGLESTIIGEVTRGNRKVVI